MKKFLPSVVIAVLASIGVVLGWDMYSDQSAVLEADEELYSEAIKAEREANERGDLDEARFYANAAESHYESIENDRREFGPAKIMLYSSFSGIFFAIGLFGFSLRHRRN